LLSCSTSMSSAIERGLCVAASDVCFGSEADMNSGHSTVRLVPTADIMGSMELRGR